VTKRRSSFLLKLYTGYVLLILLTATAIGWLANDRIAKDSVGEIETALEHQASFLSDLALPAFTGELPQQELQDQLQTLGADTDTRLTVIDADGVVLADSHEDPAVMENHGTRPEILSARKSEYGTSSRYSQTLQQRMMYFALPVYSGRQLLGYVRTSLPLSDVDRQLTGLRLNILLGVVIALLVSLPLGWLFARQVTKPLLMMTAAARKLAGGEQAEELQVASHDEIRVLADAFNAMSQQLEDRLQTITRDRNQLYAMLASMAEGVIAADRDERIVHINTVAAVVCRTTAELSTGLRTWEAIRIQPLTNAIKQAIAEGRTIEGEITITGIQRDQLFDMDVTPWRDGAGNVVGAVAVLHDVTRLRRLETLRQEFVANASHELKSPVTAIRGYAETMLDDQTMDSETRHRFTQSILAESLRLEALLGDMLALSRLEQGDLIGEMSTVSLRRLVEDVAASCRTGADIQDIAFSVELATDDLQVRGNAQALTTALRNLIDNALKYTPAGGRVQVKLRCAGDRAVIEVADSGIGIDPEHHERIFERFYRVDKARSRELGGTGLGLAIVKHTVLTHGGEISLYSAPGKGSVFTVSLPLSPVNSPS
jgi:two-component system phosphate regulon sensor histidine kinase PhoR